MSLPLEGFTVGVTAERRAAEQADLLRRRGARVVEARTIATASLEDDEALRAATTALIESPPTVLVITTGVGIRGWVEAAQSWQLDRALLDAFAGARVVARGPKSATAARSLGLTVADTAADERMSGVRALLGELAPGDHVVVQCFGDDTRDADALVTRPDVRLTAVRVYRWQRPADVGPARALVRGVLDGEVDAVTFTAAPAVRGLFSIAADDGLADELRAALNGPTVAACVGPVCAEAARAEGIREPLAPAVGRLGLMIRLLTEHLEASR